MFANAFLLLALLPVLACCQITAPGNPANSGTEITQPTGHGFADTKHDTLIDANGRTIGFVESLTGPNGLLLRIHIDVDGLTPGWHGLHLHQTGTCDDPDTFRRSGSHVGNRANAHGLLNPAGPEPGDLPNIWVATDGSTGYEAFIHMPDMTMLDDQDGTALIIHADRDDHVSQPIGGAGRRIACAVIF